MHTSVYIHAITHTYKHTHTHTQHMHIQTHTLAHTVVVEYLQTGSDDEEALAKLETGKCTQEVLRALFAGMHIILQSALRQPKLKAEVRLWHCGTLEVEYMTPNYKHCCHGNMALFLLVVLTLKRFCPATVSCMYNTDLCHMQVLCTLAV